MTVPTEHDGEGDRLDRLEQELVALRAEIAELKGQAVRSAPVDEQIDHDQLVRNRLALRNQAQLQHELQRRLKDNAPNISSSSLPPLEELVGRYGMLALGTVTVLVAVGSFLAWAIQQGLLGPPVRVALGALAAAALAFGGVRLRSRGLRDFGNVIIAMALAVMHVVCWSAGPLLHVVPTFIALLVAFATAAVLAEFALRNDEQALFCVGFGGAVIAPFVTSDRAGSLIALASYGVAVIALAAAALRDREWTMARRIVGGAFALFVFVLSASSTARAVDGATSMVAIAEHMSAILFGVAFSAVAAIAVHPRYRRAMMRLGAAGIAFACMAWTGPGTDWLLPLFAAASGALLTLGVLYVSAPPSAVEEGVEEQQSGMRIGDVRDLRSLAASALMDAAILPVALFVGTIVLMPSTRGWESAVAAGIWFVAMVGMSFRARTEALGRWYPFAASIAAISLGALLPLPLPWNAAALTSVGLLLAVIHSRLERAGFVFGAGMALAFATIGPLDDISRRVPFSYRPFLEISSLAAFITILGWLIAPRLLGQTATKRIDDLPVTPRSIATWIAAGVSFLWIQGELQGATAPAISFGSLVGFYAITGFAAIEWGRRKRKTAPRVIGLALSVLAAGKALFEALALENIGMRVGSLFLVSGFLIGVAYRYRKQTKSADATLSAPAEIDAT